MDDWDDIAGPIAMALFAVFALVVGAIWIALMWSAIQGLYEIVSDVLVSGMCPFWA